MKPRLFLFALALLPISWSVPDALAEEEPPKLLGAIVVDDLREEPYAEWLEEGYDSYVPHPEVLQQLKRLKAADDFQIDVFFGTWCGDSRREVPRLLKILDALDFPAERLRLIAVDRVEEMHKRSPGGEEKGLGIFRVPTILVHRQGEEVGRLVEHPSLSLERDLLAVLEGKPRRTTYMSYPVVRTWLAGGLLSDPNVSADGLAGEVRSLVSSESELYSPARVLWTSGRAEEGAKLQEVNCAVYRQSALCHARLAEAQERAGRLSAAKKSAERALVRDPDGEVLEGMLELLDRLRDRD